MHGAHLVLLAAGLLAATPTRAGISPQLATRQRITMSELIPLTSSRKEFKIIEGRDRGRLVPLIFGADPEDGKRWSLSFGHYGRLWLRSNAGALILDRLDLYKSRNSVIYEPALRVLPAELDAVGVIRETSYKMYSMDTGKLKRAGRVTHLVKRIARSQFPTPAGLIDGYHIEIEHKMDLEYYSQLLLTISLGCRLDDGLVYGSAHYKLRKLGGLLTETRTSTAALSSRLTWPGE